MTSTFNLAERPIYGLKWDGTKTLLSNEYTTSDLRSQLIMGYNNAGICANLPCYGPCGTSACTVLCGDSPWTQSCISGQANTIACDNSMHDLDACTTYNPVLCYCGSAFSKRPTPFPTIAPSTVSPSLNPTTRTPTVLSLLPSIYFGVFTGLTNKENLNTMDSICTSRATSLNLGCSAGSFAVVGASDRNISTFPSRFGFSPNSIVLAYTTYDTVEPFNSNWANFISNHGEYGLDESYVLSSYYIKKGVDAKGDYLPSASCNDWTSQIGTFSGSYVNGGYTPNMWLASNAGQSCSLGGKFTCLCVGTTNHTPRPTTTRPSLFPTTAPTVSPTTISPTKNPTAFPTTNPTTQPTAPTTVSPTAAPTGSPTSAPIVLFSDSVTRSGALGNRATTSATCASIASAQSLVCTNTFMVLSYDAVDYYNVLPTIFGFSATNQVKGPNGLVIANSWAGMRNAVVNTPFAAGVVSASSGRWWTGTVSSGDASSDTCSQWTSATSSPTGPYGNNGEVNFAQFTLSASNAQCQTLQYIICACKR